MRTISWLGVVMLAVGNTAVPAEVNAAADDPAPCCFLLEFNDTTPGECVNERYADIGIHITRDDRECVFAVDWSARGHRTPAPPMAIGSFAGPGVSRYNAVNVELDRLATTIVACVGNDPEPSPVFFEATGPGISASGRSPANGNTDIDQLRGTAVRPGQQWQRARWVHLNPAYAMAIDRLFISFCPHWRQCPIDPQQLTPQEGRPDICDVVETY